MKNVKVINPQSPYFKMQGSIYKELLIEENDSMKNIYEVFLKKVEQIIIFNEEDLSLPQSKNIKYIPQSRKDFYTWIHNKQTSREDIVEMIKLFQEKELFIVKNKEYSQDASGIEAKTIYDFILDGQHSRVGIIDYLRTLKNDELIEFKIPNNSYNPKNEYLDNTKVLKKMQPKNRKKQNRKKKNIKRYT